MRWRREHRRPVAAGRSGISDTPSPRPGGVLPLARRRRLTGRAPRSSWWAGAGLCASARPLRRCLCEPRRPRYRAARRCPSTLTELSGSAFRRLRSLSELSRSPAGVAAGPCVPAVSVSPRAVQRRALPAASRCCIAGKRRPLLRNGSAAAPPPAPGGGCSRGVTRRRARRAALPGPAAAGSAGLARSSCSRRAGAERLAVAGFGRVMALDRLTSHPALLLLCFVRSMRYSGFSSTQTMSASRSSPLARTCACITVLSLPQ